MNLPNKLTILRICMIPLFVAAYFLPYSWGAIAAVVIFVLAAFTDFLDGFIARKYNLVTDLGKLLDPIADKILITAALFCVVATNPLQWSALFLPNLPDMQTFGLIFSVCAATLILARELLISAVRMIAASKGIVVQANIFGKVKTVTQDIALPLLVLLNGFSHDDGKWLQTSGTFWSAIWFLGLIMLAVATLLTVVSGIIYLVQNRNVFAENSAKENLEDKL